MDDDTGIQMLPSLWIDWAGHIVSFHEVAGYERVEFTSGEERMEYAFQKSASGFRIQ